MLGRTRLLELESLGAKVSRQEKKDPRVGDAVRSAELAAQAASNAAESVGEIGEQVERMVDAMTGKTVFR